MKFHELVSSTKEYNMIKTDLMIVIPSYMKIEVLKRHLDFLQAQTYKTFNVIAVLGPDYDDKTLDSHIWSKKYDFGIIVVKRKDDTGSAGGFFTGQKYVLENEYPYHILADDDCFPTESNVVETLYSNRGHKYVAAKKRYISLDHKEKIDPNNCVAQYTLFSLDILKQHGLYFAPLYIGGDDGEYQQRVGGKPYYVDIGVEHIGSGFDFFKVFDKTWAYAVNGFVAMKRPKDIIYSFFRSYVGPLAIMITFFPHYGKKAAADFLTLTTEHKFGKEAHRRLKSGFQNYIFDESKINNISAYKKIEFRNEIFTYPIARKIKFLFSIITENFRKEMVITDCYNDLPVQLLSVVAGSAYIKIDENRWLLVCDNRNPVIHIGKIIILPIIISFLAAYFVLVLIPIKILNQPKTEKYGLD